MHCPKFHPVVQLISLLFFDVHHLHPQLFHNICHCPLQKVIWWCSEKTYILLVDFIDREKFLIKQLAR